MREDTTRKSFPVVFYSRATANNSLISILRRKRRASYDGKKSLSLNSGVQTATFPCSDLLRMSSINSHKTSSIQCVGRIRRGRSTRIHWIRHEKHGNATRRNSDASERRQLLPSSAEEMTSCCVRRCEYGNNDDHKLIRENTFRMNLQFRFQKWARECFLKMFPISPPGRITKSSCSLQKKDFANRFQAS